MTNLTDNSKPGELIAPYRSALVDLVVSASERSRLFEYAAGLQSIQISLREACDLEMLAVGAFTPLQGFLTENDYKSVVASMRLVDRTLFPIPITLGVHKLNGIKIGADIALRDLKNDLLAILTIAEVYEWDRDWFAEAVLGTNDPAHPVVSEMRTWDRFNLAGDLRVLKLPTYHDFREFRLTPRQTRERLLRLGRSSVVGFQTRNPLHRAHEAMIEKAIEATDGTLLLQPAVGMTSPGDIDHFTRVRTYKMFSENVFDPGRVMLSLLPLAMRMAGPREAVWHAIIRRNYGASHFIVGRDHASPGRRADGRPFYGADAAQLLSCELSEEIGVKILPFQEFAYLPEENRYEEMGKMAAGAKVFAVSGAQIREDHLMKGHPIPNWMVRADVADILSKAFSKPQTLGGCVWLTGLSGSGKSTTAEILSALLLQEGFKNTLLDGDVMRTGLSKGLGFSREDRNANINRVGFVAAEIAKHGGIVICALISPYREARNQVRLMFEKGSFIEIFVDTPLNICERRDPKGMYAKARRGEIKNFTGVDDVYEIPLTPEIILETNLQTAEDNARTILEYLRFRGFLSSTRNEQKNRKDNVSDSLFGKGVFPTEEVDHATDGNDWYC